MDSNAFQSWLSLGDYIQSENDPLVNRTIKAIFNKKVRTSSSIYISINRNFWFHNNVVCDVSYIYPEVYLV